ncbi:DUF5798 family protein [Haloarcula sediminis]|uniref:DUF5798 family protein n=1 Tax=Haloarcula sediminis TaxID=3111777 RepID=UPI002D7981A7|nr:DUF5798 family protein [Haloarcula sp. CK38]
MGFGSTAKKLQKVVDMADDLYAKLNEQKEQLQELRNTVEETSDRVRDIDHEQAQQRALLEAIAEEQGLDTDAVLTDAVIEDAEATADDEPTEPGSQSATETTD